MLSYSYMYMQYVQNNFLIFQNSWRQNVHKFFTSWRLISFTWIPCKVDYEVCASKHRWEENSAFKHNQFLISFQLLQKQQSLIVFKYRVILSLCVSIHVKAIQEMDACNFLAKVSFLEIISKDTITN